MNTLGLPSIEQLDHLRELNDINEQELGVTTRLLDMSEQAQTQPINEDSFALVNAAVDSLYATRVAQPPTVGGVVHSVESLKIDLNSVLAKIKEIVINILKAIIESVRKIWNWMRVSYQNSKEARENIRRRLYVLSNQLKGLKNHKQPILVVDFDRIDLPLLLEGGTAPKDLESSVASLNKLIEGMKIMRFGKEITGSMGRFQQIMGDEEKTTRLFKEITKLVDSVIAPHLEGKKEGQKMHQGQSATILNYGSFLGSFSLRRIDYTDKQKSPVSVYSWRHDPKKMRAGKLEGAPVAKHQKIIESFIKTLDNIDNLFTTYQYNVVHFTVFEKLLNTFIEDYKGFYNDPKKQEDVERYRNNVNSAKLMYSLVRSYMEMPLFLFTRCSQVSLAYVRLMEAEVDKLYREKA